MADCLVRVQQCFEDLCATQVTPETARFSGLIRLVAAQFPDGIHVPICDIDNEGYEVACKTFPVEGFLDGTGCITSCELPANSSLTPIDTSDFTPLTYYIFEDRKVTLDDGTVCCLPDLRFYFDELVQIGICGTIQNIKDVALTGGIITVVNPICQQIQDCVEFLPASEAFGRHFVIEGVEQDMSVQTAAGNHPQGPLCTGTGALTVIYVTADAANASVPLTAEATIELVVNGVLTGDTIVIPVGSTPEVLHGPVLVGPIALGPLPSTFSFRKVGDAPAGETCTDISLIVDFICS